MARNDEEGLPRPLGVLIAAILIGAVIWQLVPRSILYASLAIATVVILGIAYLIYRKRGSSPLKAFGKGIWRAVTGQGTRIPAKGASIPPLGSDDAAWLKAAVGSRCERPHCPNPTSPSLVVHHIIPRHEEGSSHKLSNLLVLCRNCHESADHDQPSRADQRQWARNRSWPLPAYSPYDWPHGL